MAAWKRTFDEFLRARDPGVPEFTQEDYNRYVDGKPRLDGVRDFLASRGITLPEGTPDDPPDAATDRKSTRLNSSHANISYAVFCLKKKTERRNSALPPS